jgi:hypothetical protein
MRPRFQNLSKFSRSEADDSAIGSYIEFDSGAIIADPGFRLIKS